LNGSDVDTKPGAGKGTLFVRALVSRLNKFSTMRKGIKKKSIYRKYTRGERYIGSLIEIDVRAIFPLLYPLLFLFLL
jgi:hypothetical protein